MFWLYFFLGLFVAICSILLAELMPFRRVHKCLVLGLVATTTCFIYSYVGAFPQLHRYILNQQEKKKITQLLRSFDGKQGLILSIKKKLDAEPDSAQGNYLLAKLLASDGRWKEAIVYFKVATSIEPDNVNYQVNFAYAIWQENHNQFNSEIRSMFRKVLKQNPNQIDSVNMLAMDAFQQKDYSLAIAYWRKLLKIVPSGTKDAKMIEEAIFRAKMDEQK